MKKFLIYSFSLMWVSLLTFGLNAQVNFNGSATNTAGNSLIPSVGSGGTVVPQTTGGTVFNNAVAGLDATQIVTSVSINLTHTFDSDLDIYLESPTGQRIELSTDNGSFNDNYTNTVFSDAGATNVTAGAAPFTGTFKPEGTLTASTYGAFTMTPTVTTLAAFAAGQNGTWKLVVFDDAGGDSGTMLGWSMSFSAAAPPPSGGGIECVLVCSGDQNITLPGGVCEYQIPNLVTMAGPCTPEATSGQRLVGFTGPFLVDGNSNNGSASGNNDCISGTSTTLEFTALDACGLIRTNDVFTVPFTGVLTFNYTSTAPTGTGAVPGFMGFGVNIDNPNPGDLNVFNDINTGTAGSGMVSLNVTAGQTLEFYLDVFFLDVNWTVTVSNLVLQGPVGITDYVIAQTSGPVAGTFVGPGTYTISFELLDPAGMVIDECEFTITVAGFPNPTGSLVCNDHVNISVDENCEITLNADMFLEGNSYACYDSYQINI